MEEKNKVSGTGFLKIIILLAIILTIIQKFTGTADFTINFLTAAESLIYVALPVLITLGGLYILIKCLFK